MDETFVGGKDRNRHRNKCSGGKGGFGSGKTGVIGEISRKGNVICQIVESLDQKTFHRFGQDGRQRQSSIAGDRRASELREAHILPFDDIAAQCDNLGPVFLSAIKVSSLLALRGDKKFQQLVIIR